MERAYVNLKREKGVVQEQSLNLDDLAKKLHLSLKEVKSLKSSKESQKLDNILLTLASV